MIAGLSSRRALVLFALLVIVPMCVNIPVVHAASDEHGIEVTIVDACYTDLDDDSWEDDVLVVVRFDLSSSDYYEFAYVITLTLPSGTSYSYLVIVLAWVDVVYTYNLFFNHATESGDYTVYVKALLVTPATATDSATYVFDPPGGSEGGKPTFGVC